LQVNKGMQRRGPAENNLHGYGFDIQNLIKKEWVAPVWLMKVPCGHGVQP